MQRRKPTNAVREEAQDEPTIEAVTVELWPTAGRTLGLRRGQAYAAAADGSIPTLRFGKLIRVSKGWLDKVARGDV
jgi:hypothetical protein